MPAHRREETVHLANFPEILTVAERCAWHQKDAESERLARGSPETNPVTIKPETVGCTAVSLLCQHVCLLQQSISKC